jgi:predicted neuraminidase
MKTPGIPQIACLLLLIVCSISLAAQQHGEFIFEPGSTGAADNHASTIVQLKNGSLMAAWFGGTKEGAPDVVVWGSTMTAGKWSKPVELVREANIACFNPVLFHTADGRLWLYYKFGAHPSSWTAGRRYSTDEGKTWSAVEHLAAPLIGPVRAKPLLLADGTIVSGSSTEGQGGWRAWIERSTDQGKSWTRIGPITIPDELDIPSAEAIAAAAEKPVESTDPSFVKTKLYPPAKKTVGIIQPAVVQVKGDHLRFYARSRSKSARIAVADSFDNGKSWTQARFLDLPNPNSGIDAVRLKDGRIVLIYNHSYNKRTPLNLAVSTDGEHFRDFAILEDGPGQYSYPAMIQGSDGDLQITYSWRRKTIKHVRFPLKDIPK